MRAVPVLALVSLIALPDVGRSIAQQPVRTLLLVAAHADDETPVGPVLARYAREGVQVHMFVITDGAQDGSRATIPRGPELARLRAEEARCAAQALGMRPPILLDFPDGKLGDYASDPSLLYRVTARLAQEVERLRPDAIITWGPDGGMGHPDHRITSNLVVQLVRAGAPGATERLFFMSIPAEGFRAMYPERGVPPLMIPEARHFTVRVQFGPEDAAAARRAMSCHTTQYTAEIVQRVSETMQQSWSGTMPLTAAFGSAPKTGLFQ